MTEFFYLVNPPGGRNVLVNANLDDVVVREIINTGWALFCWMMCAILGRRLFIEMQQDGWYAELGNRVAVGMFIYFLGSGMYRSWIVALLWGIQNDTGTLGDLYIIPFAAMVIGMLGGLCLIRLLTTSNWPWFITYVLIVFSSAFVASQKL